MKKSTLTAMALALFVAASGSAWAASVPRAIEINTGIGAPEIAASPQIQKQIDAMQSALAQASPSLQSATIMRIVRMPGPSSKSPNYPNFLGNFATYLKTGVYQNVNRSNTPAALSFPERLYWFDTTESLTTPLWMAVVNPTNTALVGERGSPTYFGISTERPAGLRLSNHRITIKSNDPYPGHPLGSLGVIHRFTDINYSSRAPGIIWGPGGKNSPGAVDVTSGSPTQIVNKVDFTGYAKFFVGETLAEFENIQAYIGPDFMITVLYELLDDAGNVIASVEDSVSVAQAPPPVSHRLAIKKFGQAVQVAVIGDSRSLFTIQSAPTVVGPWSTSAVAYGQSTLTTIPSSRVEIFR